MTIKHRNLIWFGITILISLLLIFKFGWGQFNIHFTNSEPKTQATATTDTGLFSKQQFNETVDHFPNFSQLIRETQDDEEYYTMNDFAVQPGLLATRTRNGDNGKTVMCTTMVPQGVTVAGNYLLTTAYDGVGKHNSVIYVQNYQTHKLLKTIVLHGKPHVGGITYDPQSKEVWVCGRQYGQAATFAISMKAIQNYDDAKAPLIHYNQKALLGYLTRASFITYHKQALYVGLFNARGRGHVEKFNLKKDGSIAGENIGKATQRQWNAYSESVLQQNVLTQIQGIVYYHGYTILSQSFGSDQSKLYVFKEKPSGGNYRPSDSLTSIETPAHLEQISASHGRLYMNFESGSYSYRHRSPDNVDRIVSLNLQDIINQAKIDGKGGSHS